MQKNNNEAERIINYQETIRNSTDELLRKYIDDYGIANKPLIETRMKNIVYLPDSKPTITYDFMQKYQGYYKEEDIARISEEYFDYIKINEKLQQKLKRNSFYTICKNLQIKAEEFIQKEDEIINLPFHCYSSVLENVPKDEIVEVNVKGLEEVREKYLTTCHNLGITPLTSSDKIDNLLKQLHKLRNEYYKEMLEETLWGQRILLELNYKLKCSASPKWLSQLLFTKKASNTNLKYDDHTQSTIIYVPLIETYEEIGNLDCIFLHEHHHAIETDYDGSGFRINSDPKYRILNEFRTENNAILTVENIPPIFGNQPLKNGNRNAYQVFMPLAQDFLNWYKNILNECAITHDIAILEKIFGEELLNYYVSNLGRLNNLIHNYNFNDMHTDVSVKSSVFYETEYNLRRNAYLSGVMPYQKTYKRKDS